MSASSVALEVIRTLIANDVTDAVLAPAPRHTNWNTTGLNSGEYYNAWITR